MSPSLRVCLTRQNPPRPAHIRANATLPLVAAIRLLVQPENAPMNSGAQWTIASTLCSNRLGAARWDQKQGQPYSNGRSGCFLFGGDDGAAKLAHENCHVVGAAFFWTFRKILISH